MKPISSKPGKRGLRQKDSAYYLKFHLILFVCVLIWLEIVAINEFYCLAYFKVTLYILTVLKSE